MLPVSFFYYFLPYKRAQHTQKMFVLVYSSFLLWVSLLKSQIKSTKEAWVFNAFGSINSTLLYHSVYLCFIIDLRRDNNKHNVHILNYICSFSLGITDTQFQFCYFQKAISYNFELTAVYFSRALHPGPSLNPMRGLHFPPDSKLRFISQFRQNAEFFSFLANALELIMTC